MLNLVGGALNLAWRILVFMFAMSLFWGLVKGGKSTIKDIRDTTLMAIKVIVKKLQTWLFNKYKEEPVKERKEEEPAKDKAETES